MSSRERFLAACAQQPHILKAHCFITRRHARTACPNARVAGLDKVCATLAEFPVLFGDCAQLRFQFRAAPLDFTGVPHEVTPAMTIANGKPKILKEGKTNGQQNGESIGVGNQGETLARMEVELWARLSICFWAYKTHAKPETQMEVPQ